MEKHPICRIHHALRDSTPHAEQRRLYLAFPQKHGYAGRELLDDADEPMASLHFEAVLILALAQTYPQDAPKHHPVTVIISSHAEDWAYNQTETIAHSIFTRLAQECRVEAAKFVGTAFKSLLFGCRVLQLEEAPKRWVAFGFRKDDIIPDWLRESLL